MLKSSLRFRILPRNAWRLILLTAVIAMPLRHGFLALAVEETKPAAAVPAKPAKPAQKPKKPNAPAKPKVPEKARKLTGAGLIGEIEKGIAVIGKATKDAKIDPKSKTAAPFYESLGKVADGTAALKKQLAAKDPAYFKTLAETAKSIGAMRVTAPRIGVTNKQINDGVNIVFDSFDALDVNFGKLAARKKQGGDLTEKEKAAFAKLQAQQKAIVAKLKPLKEKAVKEKNKKLLADLNGLLKQSNAIASSKPSLDAYLTAMNAYNYLAGQYDAYTYYIPPADRTVWTTIDGDFNTGYTEYWTTYDSYTVSDWSYYESTEVSYQYDYTDVSMSSEEVAEYDSSIESTDVEVSDDTYVAEDSYDESLSANEDEQDDTWDDDAEADDDDDSGDDDSGDDDSGDDDSGDDDSGDDDSGDDDSGDDDSGDDDSGDDDSGDDDSGDDDSGDDDSGDDDSGDDDSGDDDSGDDDSGDDDGDDG